MLTILCSSFIVNPKRGHTGTGFHWSPAIRQGKSPSYSKHNLGSPPPAWTCGHAEAEWTSSSARPAASVQPISRHSRTAWQTLTDSTTAAWASAGSAAWPHGHAHAAASSPAPAQRAPQASTCLSTCTQHHPAEAVGVCSSGAGVL